jgi:energy-coupling factor transporter ATP-binding protein EcfA2
MPAISVRGLTKRFGAVTAVDDLSFEVQHGTITGFLGPNGSGKTTTLRTLLGLVHSTSGTAVIDGTPYARLDRPAFTVGAVLEAAGFHPGAPPATTCGSSPTPTASRPAGWTRCSTWSSSPVPPAAGSAASPSACGNGSCSPVRCSVTPAS